MPGTYENSLMIASIFSLLQEISSSAKIKVREKMLKVLRMGRNYEIVT